MKTNALVAVCMCLIVLAPRVADAFVNPENFKHGPERLVIKVAETTTKKVSTAIIVNLRAEVVSVKRSATGLKPGDPILIRYQRNLPTIKRQMEKMVRQGESGWAGQQTLYQPQPPGTGDVVKAILRHFGDDNGRVYRPAAYQYSFEMAR